MNTSRLNQIKKLAQMIEEAQEELESVINDVIDEHQLKSAEMKVSDQGKMEVMTVAISKIAVIDMSSALSSLQVVIGANSGDRPPIERAIHYATVH